MAAFGKEAIGREVYRQGGVRQGRAEQRHVALLTMSAPLTKSSMPYKASLSTQSAAISFIGNT
jgi:hypothetical protein